MTNTECKFLGVRGPALEKSRDCVKCKRTAVEQYDQCTQETKKLEATSVVVINGVTKQSIRSARTFRSSSTEPNITEQSKPAPTKTKKPKAPEKEKIQTQGKLPRVTGVIDYCVSLMLQCLKHS